MNERDAFFVNVDEFRAHAPVGDVHHFQFALERLVRVQLTIEIESLPDLEFTCANEQQTVIAHILNNARKVLFAGIQCPTPGHCDPQ